MSLPCFTLGTTIANKSDAKRKSKLKERRKRAEEAQARPLAGPSKVEKWTAAFDPERNIIAELIEKDGTVLAYVVGDDTESWTVVVDDDPVAGTSDEVAALGRETGVRVHFSPATIA